jgi:hypothetical protein
LEEEKMDKIERQKVKRSQVAQEEGRRKGR